MFNKKAQKKVIIIVAVVLSVALAGSSFTAFGSYFSNPNRNAKQNTELTIQEQYDQLVAEIEMYEALMADNPDLQMHSYIAQLYSYKAGSGMSSDELSDWGKAADFYKMAYEKALADEAAEEAQPEEAALAEVQNEGGGQNEDEAQSEEQDKPSTNLLYDLVHACYRAQRYEDAKVFCGRLIEVKPDDVYGYYIFGLVLKEGFADNAGAIAQWEKGKSLTEEESEISFLDTLIQGAQDTPDAPDTPDTEPGTEPVAE